MSLYYRHGRLHGWRSAVGGHDAYRHYIAVESSEFRPLAQARAELLTSSYFTALTHCLLIARIGRMWCLCGAACLNHEGSGGLPRAIPATWRDIGLKACSIALPSLSPEFSMLSIQSAIAPALWAVFGLGGAVGTVPAGAVSLAPLFAGAYAAGSGVDATFLKVDDDWHLSSVLWDEASRSFGSGVQVRSYAWGAGLWGIADWQTAHLSPTPGMIERTWSGRVGSISFGDAVYNSIYSAKWGDVKLAPLFSGAPPAASQDNWTASFSGYVRIAEAGSYNFSVLHDDGFFFKLGGASAQTLDLRDDFLNARDRLGFNADLQLGVGLYPFELGAYDHLQAGVVELSWSRDGGAWSPLPGDHLVAPGDIVAVPEPATWALLLTGMLAAGAVTARRRSAASR